MSGLRVAVIVAAPAEVARFDGEAEWARLASALEPLVAQGLLTLQRVTPPSENALRKWLTAGAHVDVLHFIGHARWRRAAHYGTLTFENSTGAPREVSTQYLGSVLQHGIAPDVVILQTNDLGGEYFDGTTHSVWDEGPSVIVAPGSFTDERRVQIRLLYAHLATGSTLADAAAPSFVLRSATPTRKLVAGEPSTVASTSIDERLAARLTIAGELKRKRAEESFDVFLCHNGSDKPRVKRIADALEARGILPWLDERELPPGQPWQPLLERQMENIRSAAVFVGAEGVGPWQEQELYVLLSEFVSRRSPVIPVLLEDAPQTPALPPFLRAMTWVDFRQDDPEPLSRLIWGITGERPR